MKTILLMCVGLVAALATPVPAQTSPTSDVEAIRQEMQKMRAEYEQRIRLLERRLQQVETNQPPPGNADASIGTVQFIPALARLHFQSPTESRDVMAAMQTNQAVLKQKLERVLNNFVDIGGYFRAGYGRDDQGGPQPAFQAPGAFAKYRLGNETENYGELIIGKNWYVPDLASGGDGTLAASSESAGPVARTQVRLAFYDPYTGSGGNNFQTTLPEAWASIGNIMASQPDFKFWAGSRFYRRQDIHINDFFFYNMSGAGGGVEDFDTGFGKLALAWIGNGAQSGVYSSDIAALPDPNNLAGFSKQSLDLSLYDVDVPLGKGELAVVFSSENCGKDASGKQADDANGVAFNFIHTRDHFLCQDGVNRFSLQFGTGAAKTFTSGYETVALTNGTYIIPDDQSSWRFRATESFVADINPHFSISPALVYQYTDYHNGLGRAQWFSGGVRPVYHFNNRFGIAFEGGVDHVIDDGPGRSGTLYKLTLAPEVSLGHLFFSRPVLRAYVTYAGWTDSYRGSVGGNDYRRDTGGWAWGMQMETWW